MSLVTFVSPFSASAADADYLVDYINSFDHGGTGTLTAELTGRTAFTVTVTGNVTGVRNTLHLDIDREVTVIWKAEYSADAPDPRIKEFTSQITSNRNPLENLIIVTGDGKFEVAAGGSVINRGKGNAIKTDDGRMSIVVSGGTVEVTDGVALEICNSGPTNITISGGVVSAANGYAIRAYNEEAHDENNTINVNVKGNGVVRAGTTTSSTGFGIYCFNSVVTVSENGEVSAIGASMDTMTIWNVVYETSGKNATTTVSGGKVNNTGDGYPIYGGDVTVSGGAVTANVVVDNAAYGAAIYGNKVNISGGTVNAIGGDELPAPTVLAAEINISGGTVLGNRKNGTVLVGVKIAVSDGTVTAGGNGGSAISSYGMDMSIIVSGGTVTASGDEGTAILNHFYPGSFSPGGKIMVSGGTVSSTGRNGIAIRTDQPDVSIFVSGGTVSSTQGSAICAEGENITNTMIEVRENGKVSAPDCTIFSRGDKSTVTINGGTVSATAAYGRAICVLCCLEPSTLNVNGGTIKTAGNRGKAIDVVSLEAGNGVGNTVNITGGSIEGCINGDDSTIFKMSGGSVIYEKDREYVFAAENLQGAVAAAINLREAVSVDISGGTVSSVGEFAGPAINVDAATTATAVNITGGILSSTERQAIYIWGPNIFAKINGGFVFSPGTKISGDFNTDVEGYFKSVITTGSSTGSANTPTIGGTAVVCGWDKAAGNREYIAGTTKDLVCAPSGATAKWGTNKDSRDSRDTKGGISYANGANTGFYAINGVKVKAGESDPEPEPAPEPEGSMYNFAASTTYTPGQFSDVGAGDWYAPYVATVYEYGIMLGSGNNQFNPAGNMKLSEAITIAVRIRSIYLGGVDTTAFTPPGTDGPWYQSSVDYAIGTGMIKSGDFTDYNRYATRAEMAYIFSRSLPESEFPARNTVNSLPDVNSGTPYYSSIIMLYEAGIVSGSDAAGKFNPQNNITRAEAAVIISRVILVNTRLYGKTYG